MKNGLFVCVDNTTFEKVWEFSASDAVVGTPAFDINNAYIADEDAFIYSLDMASGKENWKYNIGSALKGNLVVDKNNICAANRDGEIYLLSSAGKLIWTTTIVGGVVNSIAVNNNMIGVGTDSGLFYIISEENGKTIARVNVEQPVLSGVTALNDNFYFGAGNGFYAVDSSGKVVWKKIVDSDIKSAPDINNNLVVFSTETGVVYCLKIEDGKQKWRYVWNNSIYSRALNVSQNNTFVSDEEGSILDLYYK